MTTRTSNPTGLNEPNGIEIRGTINQMRKFKSYANNHYTYCGGGVYFFDTELEKWLSIFRAYGLFDIYDSFAEHYHNVIVD